MKYVIDKDKNTPLNYALNKNNLPTINYLLDYIIKSEKQIIPINDDELCEVIKSGSPKLKNFLRKTV